jgi:predicted transcriptional regulator
LLIGIGQCGMPDIASILKVEISRLARKEARRATDTLKKAVSVYRTEIAALKRRTEILEREIKRTRRATVPQPRVEVDASESKVRFSAKGLAAQRQRLGLSVGECALLLGASGQSIYNWERGNARPRASHMPKIVAMRRLSKRQAAGVIESLRKS